jgi:hypothetical protein
VQMMASLKVEQLTNREQIQLLGALGESSEHGPRDSSCRGSAIRTTNDPTAAVVSLLVVPVTLLEPNESLYSNC